MIAETGRIAEEKTVTAVFFSLQNKMIAMISQLNSDGKTPSEDVTYVIAALTRTAVRYSLLTSSSSLRSFVSDRPAACTEGEGVGDERRGRKRRWRMREEVGKEWSDQPSEYISFKMTLIQQNTENNVAVTERKQDPYQVGWK
jgi:hypothetical protein